MAAICNRVAQLDTPALEAKSALGESVSIAVLGALSDSYKAIENFQTVPAAKFEVVYLQSAAVKLETAEIALRKMRDILASVPPSDEAIAWLAELDYDRLYQDGTQRGLIPSSIDQWNRLAQINRTQNYLGVADALIADANSLRAQIESLIETLTSAETPASLEREAVRDMLGLQSALAELAVFGQMVAYFNAIEPLADEWRGAAVATATIF